MRARTHLAFGFFSGLVLMNYIHIGDKYLFFIFLLLGTLIPDIDIPNSKISRKIPLIPRIISLFAKHRGIFHSIFLALGFAAIIWIFNPVYGIALFAGYFSHLFLDCFTKQGVNLLHPISRLRISGPIRTGKISELVLFAVIVAGIVFSLIR